MGSYYGLLLSIIRDLYTEEELTKFPDYNWLIFNMVCFMSPSKTFPKVIPMPFEDTYWGNLFWLYYDYMAYQTESYGIMDAFNEFKNPSSNAVAQTMFDLMPLCFQEKFYMSTKLKLKHKHILQYNINDNNESHYSKIFEENVVDSV